MKFDILLVDDDLDTLFLHEILIKKSGLNPSPKKFDSGKKIIDFLKSTPPNTEKYLIFLDIYMTDINGWDVLNFIETLKLYSNLKVMLLSSSVNFEDKRKAMDYPSVIEYIEKPLMLHYLERLKEQAIF
ncbi:response regulator [Algoriphagus hitonicola]|uniref:Response regulator receiver domain-containing protein n=1 Tax=Algoriphagus hitonicola TaxID=435880 RepID=A0A1I2NN30_9BACT|nr:response regulator [Algoriphagus hitonicola]SFG04983.1 Response regulator receiver domain-containing protein [Algoriphagus hitonicola]